MLLTMGKRCFFFILLLFFCALSSVYAETQVDVQVNGVSSELQKNIMAFLTIAQQKSYPDLSEEGVRRLFNKGPNEIRKALEPFGYYRSTIQSKLEQHGNSWTAYYTVDPGPPLKIVDIDVRIEGEGEKDPQFEKLVKSFPLSVDQIMDQRKYENAKSEFQQLASERGYFDAKFSRSEILIDMKNYTASVFLYFDTGPRYRFGRVIFEQDTFRTSFLQRFVGFKQGQPYTLSALLDLQNALIDSDYFRQVDVAMRQDLTEGLEVPVGVKLVPQNATKYSAGVGYGTDTGARASLGVERRYINRSGHRWSAIWKVSQIGNSINARYVIPLGHPNTDQLNLSAGREEERVNDTLSRKWLISTSYTRLDHGWQKTLFLNYQRELYKLGTEQSPISILVLPGINWTRINANNRLDTTFGNRFLIEFRGASKTLGSNTSFFQTRLGIKLIRSYEKKNRIIMRGDLGLTQMYENYDFSTVPISMRFFAGGENSLRGYNYNSIGPREDGITVGGQYLAVGSIEYLRILNEKWGLAAFFDMGDVENQFTLISRRIKRGVGVGVRYQSPVGPIRVDLAYRLVKAGEAQFFNITIGPEL